MARKKGKRFSPEQKLKIVKEGMMPDVQFRIYADIMEFILRTTIVGRRWRNQPCSMD
jgi:hypothetical protein